MTGTGHVPRAQVVAGFWGLFGLYMIGTGVGNYLDVGLGVSAVGYLVLGAAGISLGVVYLTNPDQVPRGNERVDRRVEAVVAVVLAVIAVVSAYVLLA